MFSFLRLTTISHICINSYCILGKKKTMSKNNFNVLGVKTTEITIFPLVNLLNTANVNFLGTQTDDFISQ